MNINIILFPDFETLDAFGPTEVLGCMDEYHLHYVSVTGGMIRSSQGIPVFTENINDADLSGVLLIPGGQGTRPLVSDVKFIEKLTEAVERCAYCLTVCTGSALLAKTGLLDHKKATSNKRVFAWVASLNTNIAWMKHARWVVDQKFYTSSGVSAGVDMALGFIADRFGRNKAQEIAKRIEYIWNSDPDYDPFCE